MVVMEIGFLEMMKMMIVIIIEDLFDEHAYDRGDDDEASDNDNVHNESVLDESPQLPSKVAMVNTNNKNNKDEPEKIQDACSNGINV